MTGNRGVPPSDCHGPVVADNIGVQAAGPGAHGPAGSRVARAGGSRGPGLKNSRVSRAAGSRERGAAALEFALVVPLLVLLMGLVVGGGRVWFARASVDAIAGSSARAASLARSAAEAEQAAHRVAALQAVSEAVHCAQLEVAVDAGEFAVPVGQPAMTRVHLRCAVPLADLLVPGWPGQLVVESTATSVIDRYRGRS